MPDPDVLYEVAQRFGAIDSDAVVAGAPGAAWRRRAIARNTNRLANHGGPMMFLTWNCDPGTEVAEGALGVQADYATWPSWQRIIPGQLPVPHKGNLAVGEAHAWARIDTGRTIYLQIGTTAARFSDAVRLAGAGAVAQSPNVLAMLGTGDWAEYHLYGLPLGSGLLEFLELGIVGTLSDVLATGIGTNTGEMEAVYGDGCEDLDASNSGAILLDRNRYWLAFRDERGGLLTAPRLIERAESLTPTGTRFRALPRLTTQESQTLPGATYEIWEATAYQLGSITIYESDDFEG